MKGTRGKNRSPHMRLQCVQAASSYGRKESIIFLAHLIAALVARAPAWADDNDEVTGDKALRLTQQAIVFDAHCDTVLKVEEGLDLGKRNTVGHIDIPRMRAGGLDIQLFALWPDPDDELGAPARTLQLWSVLMYELDKHPELEFVTTAAQARQAISRGHLAAFIGIEGGSAIAGRLELLRAYHRIGVRLMTLTWMKNTSWADAAGDEPAHHGLTELGRKIVREMNRLGMVVDVSHVSDETFFDVLEVSEKPVVASHSGARAICPHFRNLSDEMLRAISKNGGVVGVNYFVGFLDPEAARISKDYWNRLEKLWKRYHDKPDEYRKLSEPIRKKYRRRLPRVTVAKLADHIDHIAKVAGIDHVGLGSDFDGICCPPEGLEDASRLPNLVRELLHRGYTEADIRKVLGENMLRVFEQAIGE
ncbi:MAG: membrane dipeptidase [Deltaproteobacteria bacterium]|nr:MAG: membrane dipeptidase [Deltaproteobacteria bacterium]